MHPAARRRHPAPGPLGWMLVLSLGIHGLLLAHWPPPAPTLAPQAPVLNLQLAGSSRRPAEAVGVQADSAPVPPAASPGREPPRRTATRPPLVRPPLQPRQQKPPAPPAATARPPAPAPRIRPATTAAPRPAAPSSARLLAEVRLALARHFRYPPLARRRGWEGEVRLGFTLNPDGRIEDVRVTRSSGYRLLDRSAREALSRVGRVSLAAWRLGAARELELPVQYRLTGS
ncbi:TonB family protein [Thiohalobacter sp. IOR34]|uniref:energy transducer TonB n=1 Tax=Thiohalobacter sp. IOR34 TaxID=3057176 RepID=UPI0025B0BD5B|nr:energy transducer TonB [Thiohalobacter sp. IOR34]WJW75152.1 TonB family protein [Thiohalobacter sp. IOR34]